jgi:hypothetical protein
LSLFFWRSRSFLQIAKSRKRQRNCFLCIPQPDTSAPGAKEYSTPKHEHKSNPITGTNVRSRESRYLPQPPGKRRPGRARSTSTTPNPPQSGALADRSVSPRHSHPAHPENKSGVETKDRAPTRTHKKAKRKPKTLRKSPYLTSLIRLSLSTGRQPFTSQHKSRGTAQNKASRHTSELGQAHRFQCSPRHFRPKHPDATI